MLIWRIENKNGGGMYRGNGLGMYRSNGLGICDIASYMTNDRHPSPMWDSGLGYYDIPEFHRDSYKFGFASLSQMRQWVHKAAWRRELDKFGYLLNCYRVPENYGRRSNFQAIFHEDHAELVESRKVCYADAILAK